MKDIIWKTVTPEFPYYFFKNKQTNSAEYSSGIAVNELFPTYVVGVKTSDDEHLISYKAFDTGYDQMYDYRPFDIRHIDYDLNKVARHRYEVMKNFVDKDNYGLVINRQVVTDNWSHVQIVKNIIDSRLHYSRKGNPVVCPLWVYNEYGREANVNYELVRKFENSINKQFTERLDHSNDQFDHLELFDYVYGILFSKKYREKYSGLLAIDFPKVPIPDTAEMFDDIRFFGKSLRNLHLFECDIANELHIRFCGQGDAVISKIALNNGCLYINKEQYFTNISDTLWNYPFGGYRSLQKWFKDRKGQHLNETDIIHVIKSFNVLSLTMLITEKIDNKLEAYCNEF